MFCLPEFVGTFQDAVDELIGDVDGVDATLGADGLRKQPRKQPRAGADVGHRHAGRELAGRHQRLSLVVDLAAFFFEAFDPFRDDRLGKRIIDARPQTLVLRCCDATVKQQDVRLRCGQVVSFRVNPHRGHELASIRGGRNGRFSAGKRTSL